ncbi:Imm1 family immunity protein [Streptomyces sp. NPDC046909]|uniref:Imm1 family immunity protein n=1 Tax=Streptomyces sp. NPDC046909 TaxID=3155617 RepID=UPI0033DC3FC6
MKSDRYFDSCLQVSTNPLTGYGALTWLIPEGSEVRVDQEIARSVWISKNPEPPKSGQCVVADFGDRRMFEPGSVLLISEIRAAVEEFCELRTGSRPAAVCWERASHDVRRFVNIKKGATPSSYCDDPWCRDSGTRHPFH